MNNPKPKDARGALHNRTITILGFAAGAVAFALLFVFWVYPEVHTAIYTLGGLLVVILGVLAWLNQRYLQEAIKTRSVRYGANAAVTVGLVLAILIVINFLNYNHYFRSDLTQNKVHSLSDQTIKILKNLQQEVRVTAFVKPQARDQAKTLFDNYMYYGGNRFKVEYVDPDRDPARAKTANIKKYGTVLIEVGKKDTRIEEITEEKITNGLIKVLKEKNTQVCFVTGHGEKSIDQAEAEGYSAAKKELEAQSYEIKSVSLLEEEKIPESCNVLVVLGSNKAFFEKEITSLQTWLDTGGRALFALDTNMKGGQDLHPELTKLLSDWYIQFNQNFIVDTSSRAGGITVAAVYNKEHPITRDFQVITLFPFASTVEFKPNPPASLKTWWLAKSTSRAFVKTNLKEVATGRVQLDQNKDLPGPHQLMVAVEGSRTLSSEGDKDKKKDQRQARIIAIGTSHLATNAYSRFGANLDLFLNAVSWLADDESLISIRPKEDSAQVPTLSQTAGRYIQLMTMILIPGGVLLFGAAVWWRRRKL